MDYFLAHLVFVELAMRLNAYVVRDSSLSWGGLVLYFCDFCISSSILEEGEPGQSNRFFHRTSTKIIR